ncbi:MAG TPA: hypothetical protein VHH88_01925 [Verrucomicrobiae bacterium]|nr:hypothetical protein [Verrucomicrobiae bacterium]
MFSRIKDAALEKAIRMFVGPKIERYGEIRELSLDTTNKTISAEIKLRGEALPVAIAEAHYDIVKRGGDTFMAVRGIKISREWAQNLLDDHFPSIEFKVPDFVAPLIG